MKKIISTFPLVYIALGAVAWSFILGGCFAYPDKEGVEQEVIGTSVYTWVWYNDHIVTYWRDSLSAPDSVLLLQRKAGQAIIERAKRIKNLK